MDMHVPRALLAPAPSDARELAATTEYFFSEQLCALYDREQRAMWLRWNPLPRPNFNPALLHDLDRYCQFMAHSAGGLESRGESMPLDYAVLASKVPGVFNLGGDLSLFARLIEAQDREGLVEYGRACVKVLYRNYLGHGLPITTVSLVQGECLGGGFEAALSSDVIIAERQSRFGFPEILFNLFPGMGAYSFLDRKIGKRATEELLGSGRLYSAEDMLAMGIIDGVAEPGCGEAEVANVIRARGRSQNARAGIAAARRCVHQLDYQELLQVVDVWVDTALNLSSRDLKLMQRLVVRQNELRAAAHLDDNGMGKQLH